MVYLHMAEKKTPHHDLAAIKLAFSTGRGQFTGVASRDAASLGYGTEEIVAIIQKMEKGQLYESMTSNYDTKVWQDVYHVLMSPARSTSSLPTMVC